VRRLVSSSRETVDKEHVSVFETSIRGEIMKHAAVQFVGGIFILVYLHVRNILGCWSLTLNTLTFSRLLLAAVRLRMQDTLHEKPL